MPRPPVWYLQKIDLFDTLNDEQMMQAIADMEHCEYPSKHILYSADEPQENTYILKEGEITLYQMIDGKKIIIDILKPGSIFGNIGVDTNSGQGVYAEVSEKAFLCKLPKNFFVQLLQTHPDVALKAFTLLGKRIDQYQSQLKFLSILSAKDRILATIKLINQKDDQSILPEILRRPTKITHEKMANMTGLTRETVTKQLQRLEEEKQITIEKKSIRLTENGHNTVNQFSS